MISSGETILFTSGLFFELPLQEHTYSFFIRILFITNCKLHSEFDEDNLHNVSFTKKHGHPCGFLFSLPFQAAEMVQCI